MRAPTALYRNVFTDATRPARGVERVGTLNYTHPVVLPEDVEASYEVASPVLRVLAFLLDLTVMMGALVVLLMTSVFFFSAGGMGAALWIILVFTINIGYFFIFEGLFAGRTIGKRALGLRVIRQDGEEIGPREGIVRAFVRLIEMGTGPIFIAASLFAEDYLLFLAPFMLLWVIMFIDKRHRRVGDFVAGTLVVVQRNLRNLPPRAPVPGYFQLDHHFFPLDSRELARLSIHDYAKLEEFGARIRMYRAGQRNRSAMVFAGTLATKMKYGHPVKPEHAERFLFEVHAALKEQLRQLYPDLYA